MKPFNAAFWAVTSNHIPIRNVLAVAISFFHLITHVLNFLYLSSHKSWAFLIVLLAHLTLTKSLNALLVNTCLFNSIETVWIFQSLRTKFWKIMISLCQLITLGLIELTVLNESFWFKKKAETSKQLSILIEWNFHCLAINIF